MKYDLLAINPAILGGKPCIKGTRISVQLILEWIASGATAEAIVSKYPHLTKEAVRQAVLYASEVIRNEVIVDIEKAA